ncbi:hypothetical protein [Streptomyces soliscabiei]|uniref:hypothetical protein n=1 Tax=Streptomyces soliscabiei TaxID=588897 RepID=UPI0029A6A06A|nr:hypothetical protein [Streptomyces sp. NY05-11A]MDX2678194.1 hypothetical protein [Streptomyces sp. NY05-11A]
MPTTAWFERAGHGEAEAAVEAAARHGHQPCFRIGAGRRRRRLSAEEAVQNLTPGRLVEFVEFVE